MRLFTPKRNTLYLSSVLMLALALMHCEPGKSLDPTVKTPTGSDSSKVATIEVVSAPTTVLPTDTGSVQVSISDSATGNPLKGATLAITSTRFSVLSASADKAFDVTVVPDDGKVSFRVYSATPGTGTITVKVTAGTLVRSIPISLTVTEKPVAPAIMETLPQKLTALDTALVVFQVVDSAQEKPLANAVVTVSSSQFQIFSPTSKDTMTFDTTGSSGKVSFRVLSLLPGTAGTLQVKVKTAAGVSRQITYTLSVAEETGSDRPRKMVFTAVRSTLRADGGDSTELRVLVKDDNNNPLSGEKITFTSTGGVVKSDAVTDAWGLATTTLKSERVNKSVIVTATLVKTGSTAQQTVAFDGVTITIAPQKRVLMVDSLDGLLFELKDGGNVPMSGDSLEIVVSGATKGFAQQDKDSMLIVTDTRGQYRTNITSHVANNNVIITARALGAKAVDTVTYTSNTMTISASKSSIFGDGSDQVTVTATLKNGNGGDLNDRELRWTTTFGTFTTQPFSSTAGGSGSITLKAPQGSGLAIVNVEAYTKSGNDRQLEASGSVTIPIKALRVSRLELKVTPDNIPVKIGQTNLIAQAFDSAGNVMTGVLVGFRLVKGAGGGDEVISPPVDYTKAGQATATLKAGGVISLYQGVKLTAVALDISGTDTLVVAASDTVGLTISGPPHFVSVGVNIEKGINPEDGTFALPSAAVVTDVNGNLVADGTLVNFSTTPIGAYYFGLSYHLTNTTPYYDLGSDTTWYFLRWGDYNNNKKLEPDERSAIGYPANPARGEDRDGNGYINLPPETFEDINHNGLWDSVDAEPIIPNVPVDTSTHVQPFVDFNKDGIRQSMEPFNDINHDGKCQCAGQTDASGNLYEETEFGSTPNHPFPGEVSVGVTRQVETKGGKAVTQIIYVQSMARYVAVRLTAESDGIRSFVEVTLPIIKSN